MEYLAKDQTKVESFTHHVQTARAVRSSSSTIDVTITGTNDEPVVAAADVTGGVTELVTPVGNLTDSGTIAFTDVDLTDVHSIGADHAFGRRARHADGEREHATRLAPAWRWGDLELQRPASAVEYLAKDQTKVESFTITLRRRPWRHDGSSTIDVTITGTNDAPIVAAADVTGGVTELVTPVGNLTDSGTIAFTDVDLTDAHQRDRRSCASAGALGTLTASVRHRHDRHRPWWGGDLELQRLGVGG